MSKRGQAKVESPELELSADVVNTHHLRPTFGAGFLDFHAGSIIADPRFALTELVANAWDAGATRVDIVWPSEPQESMSIADNGIGMSRDEFVHRWTQLNYNRQAEQGSEVRFPSGRTKRNRLAFGRNGVGRHALFCFAEEYTLETIAKGERTTARIRRSTGEAPYVLADIRVESHAGHGTRLSVQSSRWTLDVRAVGDLLASRFLSDPEFEVFLNGRAVSFAEQPNVAHSFSIEVPSVGSLRVTRVDAEHTGRTSQHSGIAWWTNRRLVGTPSWDTAEGAILDARTAVGKRLVYVIEADCLAAEVLADWSGYKKSEIVATVLRVVNEAIRVDVGVSLSGYRRERKRVALSAHRRVLTILPPLSQESVARFVDEIQARSPSISSRDLGNAVQVLAALELSRSGYELLERLAKLSSDDLAGLNDILQEWNVADIKAVLGELKYRLKLIRQLESLVEKHTADELHDLQPLFERGLWIFGPEFESISFTSNRSLATVVRELLGGAKLSTPRKRPDFVVLPDASLGLYSADAFDSSHQVSGLAHVVVVELKRGGFRVGFKEKDQAAHYCREVRRSGKVQRSTRVTAYVLGTEVEPEAQDPQTEGETTIIARSYQAVLRQAHARTFNLLQKIESSGAVSVEDAELREVLGADQAEAVLGSASSDEDEVA